MPNGDEGPPPLPRCKWVWLGDSWGQMESCPNPVESCGEPTHQGTFIGEIAYTDCSS